MQNDFNTYLGGILHFLDVEKNDSLTPRDRFMARRIWFHRAIPLFSSFLESKSVNPRNSYSKDTILKLDHLITELEKLRKTECIEIDKIEDLYIQIKKLLVLP